MIAYWIAPWLGVVFTDYWLRRGDLGEESVFYSRAHNTWSGLLAMLVAGAVSIYFFAAQALYTGPVPMAAPQLGDLTFLVGFVLAAIVYAALHGFRPIATPRAEAVETVA